MVDVAEFASVEHKWDDVVARRVADAMFVATAHTSVDRYLAACANLTRFAPPQSPLWVSTWLKTTIPDAVMVTVTRNNEVVFGFGLQTLRKGSFKIARVLGLTHSNANFFPLSDSLAPADDLQCVEIAVEALRKARPDIHALVFERLAPEHYGRTNPLLSLPSQPSPNIALALDTSGGFEAVLDAVNGHRKRKRNRYLARKLGTLGEVRFLRPRAKDDILRVIDAFFAMKAASLRQKGATDVFGDSRVRSFFRSLFIESARSDDPAFVLDALEVAGKIRAVTGSCIDGDRLICDFAGFEDDDAAAFSPGDFLLHENIRQAAQDGFAIYDLGVGDEPYKRSWCDIETRHFDVFLALTPVGRVLVAAQRAKTRAIAAIKGNAFAWRIAKAVRGAAIQTRAQPSQSED